jgi:hypothetical protein
MRTPMVGIKKDEHAMGIKNDTIEEEGVGR